MATPPAPPSHPITSLSHLAALHTAHTSSHASSHASYLRSLVEQRTCALLALGAAVSQLERELGTLGKREGEVRRAGEAEMGVARDGREQYGKKGSEKSGRERAARTARRVAAAHEYEQAYYSTLNSFEREWEAGRSLFERHDLLESSPPIHPSFPPDSDATSAIQDFLATILNTDSYVLGQGLAMLPDLSSLLASLSPASTSSSSPLDTLLRFIASTAPDGVDTLFLIAQGVFETAVRELVGREKGSSELSTLPSAAEEQDGGIGLGIKLGSMETKEVVGEGDLLGGRLRRRKGTREKELEGFLVGLLDTLDGLGLVVETCYATTSTTSDSTKPPSLGPFAFHQPAIETLLLSFLSSANSLRASSLSPPPPSPAHSPQTVPSSPPPSSWSPTTFLHTSFTTLTAAPLLAARSVHSAASTFPTSAREVFGYPTPPLSNGSGASPKVPSSPESPNKPLPRLPFGSSSRFVSPPSPSPSSPSSPSSRPVRAGAPWSRREHLLVTTATSLLRILAPSPSHLSSRPLVQALLTSLLSTTFASPPSSSASPEHSKLLSLSLIRWYSFRHLGAFLRSPTSFTPSSSAPSSLLLPISATSPPLPSPHSAPTGQAAGFLQSVQVDGAMETEWLVPLHREVYAAVTVACSAQRREDAASEEEEEGKGEEQAGRRALRSAAEAFVKGWETAGVSIPPTSTPGREEGTLQGISVGREELRGLYKAVGEVVLPLGSDGGPKKGAESGEKWREAGREGGAVEEKKEEEEGENGEETLRERMERVLSASGAVETKPTVFYVSRLPTREGTVSTTLPLPLSPRHPPPISISPPLPPGSLALLRRSLLTLVPLVLPSALFSLHDEPTTLPTLLYHLSTASTSLLQQGFYASHALLSRAYTVFSSPVFAELDVPSLLSHLAHPYLSSAALSAADIATAQTQLSSLAALYASLRLRARAALGRVQETRVRAWIVSVEASEEVGRELRARLTELRRGGRSEEEKERARREVREWREEVGIIDFLSGAKSDGSDEYDEALMLVETAAAVATQPEVLLNHGLYRREARALGFAAEGGGEEEDEDGRMGGGIASTLLGAPGAFLGSLPIPVSPFPSTWGGTGETAAAEATPPLATSTKLVVDATLGAVLPSLLVDAPSSSSADDYLSHLSAILSSSLFYSLYSPSLALIPLNPNSTDTLFSLLLSPASPLPLFTSPCLPSPTDERRPRPLLPTRPRPPEYVGELLRRFVMHPSVEEKLSAVVEAEKVLVELLEAEVDGVGLGETTEADAEDVGRARQLSVPSYRSASLRQARERLRSASPASAVEGLQRLFRPPFSSTPSFDAGEGASTASSASASSEPNSPRRTGFDVGAAVRGAAGGESGTWRSKAGTVRWRGRETSVLFPVAPDDAGRGAPTGASDGVSTDALLAALENAILHFLPLLVPHPPLRSPTSFPNPFPHHSSLFATLHLVSSLSPSLACSSSHTGKAFSDLLVASLAIREDVLEGEGGLVERGWQGVREGTESGREKAREVVELALWEGADGAKALLTALC